MLFDLLGFGRHPNALAQSATIDPTTGLAPSLRMTAAALGLPLDEVTCTYQYAVAAHPVTIAAGRIEAGTIAAIRMEISGVRAGKPLIVRNALWYLTRDLEPRWELPASGWHYRFAGDVPMDVMITHPVSEEYYPKMSPGLTAHPVVNAIPYVCEAPAGLLQTNELPQIIGNFQPV
jgi:4-hydroxy-tetrahydrodipicolinate reductase